MWVYAQNTGNIYGRSQDDLSFLTRGYSGRGQYMNDPGSQCVREFGPLPRGLYSFSAPTTFNFMSDCLRLIPARGNDMCTPARDGFWMHDGIFSGPHGDSSHGCICLKRPARLVMWHSGDHDLEVRADDPQGPAAAWAIQDPTVPPEVGKVAAAMPAAGDAGPPDGGAVFALAVAPQDTTFTLRKGRHYEATVKLSFFEQLATNAAIADMLKNVGFLEVSVTGTGGTRTVEGSWPGADVTGPIDPHLSDIHEVEFA